jgi:hypothetical protein
MVFMRWCGKLKASHMTEDWKNKLKISTPLPLRESYRFIPLSAKLISLGCPFKKKLSANDPQKIWRSAQPIALCVFSYISAFSVNLLQGSLTVLFKSFKN